MVKSYLKTFPRTFRRHLTRFVSVFLMVLLSVGFSAGIGMATDKMRYAMDELYTEKRMSDIIVRAENDLGEKQEALEALGYEVVQGGFLDFETGKPFSETPSDMPATVEAEFSGLYGSGATRVYFFESEEDFLRQNTPETIDEAPMPATAPAGSIPIAVERGTEQLHSYVLGDVLTAEVSIDVLGFKQTATYTFVVTKIVENPLHRAVRLDPSTISVEGREDDYQELDAIFYLVGQKFPLFGREMSFPNNSLYLKKEMPTTLFSDNYDRAIEAAKEEVEGALEDVEGAVGVLTLHENFTLESYYTYADKVEVIGYVLMVVFLAVTLLVVLSAMTRLLDEERAQIACCATLGYSPMQILSKYLLFAAIGTVLGAAGGYGASIGLAYIIYINFNWNFDMLPFPAHVSLAFFMIVASIICISTVAATAFAGLKKLSEAPASQLRPKAPRPGKKVFLEHIPVLWNRLSFTYKSTMRNVLRFKMRFAMTVVAVMASTALVLAGLAVLDCCIFQDIGTKAMIAVGVVVVLFAALLNLVVIYTLATINISERERELATLMVLGYHQGEVAMYVYREIYITGTIGTLLGVPFGALLTQFVFTLLEVGALSAIHIYVWFAAPLLSVLFTLLSTLLLRRKITKIDMNDSLKAIE